MGPLGLLGRCPSANLGTGDDSSFLVGWQDGGAPAFLAGPARSRGRRGPSTLQDCCSSRNSCLPFCSLIASRPPDLGTKTLALAMLQFAD